MLAKRIIPCLDVKDNVVVKGVQFRNHVVMGDIVELAKKYSDNGADELVFYDITASSDNRTVSNQWIANVAECLNIPFCVAGGIRSIEEATQKLNAGADKISINSPALENPQLIEDLAKSFGSQCVVVGVDSFFENGDYHVYQYTGDSHKTKMSGRKTKEWVKEIVERGAGEIVLNCMNQDGVKKGYDLTQLKDIRSHVTIPLIASGGAGCPEHFAAVFKECHVDGALAASVFHSGQIDIQDLKHYLNKQNIKVRL